MKTLTIKGKSDGFGAQYQAILSGIAYCNYMNYKYIHTPFSRMSHNENITNLNQFIGIPPSNETQIDIIEKCCGDVHFSKNPDIYYTPEVLTMIRTYYYSTNKPNIKNPDIAIHIRRGDVKENNEKRFTNNDQYKQIISVLLETYPNYNITIFSEGKKEDFNDFINERIYFQLNTDIEDTFHSLVSAKILVTAKSSFSYCAALLNNNDIYYLPFWHNPLKHWKLF
tara:strand:+ start:708 stop:1382 length:675 start_codon:yes stop_codon:yes gene_type:complete